ncbi:MAG: PDZ domain-containing protein [Bacteriovorax sp.]|nr:PDZ domain-containing protein [Bacteriovorax sp.]
MKLSYKLIIETPSTHQVRVIIEGKKESLEKTLDFFLPRWSPGSYMMREYSRNISRMEASTKNGERLDVEQIDTSVFKIDWNKSELKKEDDFFTLSYWVYCHELTVRTSHVDDSHAFLHLPTLLMGIVNTYIEDPTIELVFPPIWSHLTTGLKDISVKREVFIYTAPNYDDLIDSPIEIGCHETDGFQVMGIDHHLAFYGAQLPHKENIKEDTKKIVEHIGTFMGGLPYAKYSFITHFSPGVFGGLEHANSTALQFCPTQITNRKGYVNYLALVAHEYFHTWNVKRIRPLELGPFHYLKEAHTKLLWLAEGLTSLMDDLFIYRMGLITLEEYLDMQKENLNRYYATPGKKFHSLDESSYNAWIKLYRPDENSNNSSISYYLKGGIVFFALNILLSEKNKSINDFLSLLWRDYQQNPERGLTADQVYRMIEEVGGSDVRNKFEVMTSTTEDIDLETICSKAGLRFDWEKGEVPWLGIEPDFKGDSVYIKSVMLDGPAFKAGLNAGDEIIAINGMRILKDRFNEHAKFLRINENYNITVCRLSLIHNISLIAGVVPAKLKGIVVIDKALTEKVFNPKTN